jgi:hypothetical protein
VFAILKALADIVVQAISFKGKLEDLSDRRAKRNLAQALHLVYLRLNESISCGEQIVDLLQDFLQNPKQYYFDGRFHIKVQGVIFRDLVFLQTQNLKNLAQCLNEFADIVKVLDPNLYLRLAQFTAFKGVGLDWVAILMRRGNIVFNTLSSEDLELLTPLSQFMLDDRGDSNEDPLAATISGFLPWYNAIADISRRMDEHLLDYDALLNKREGDSSDDIMTDEMERLRRFLTRNDLKQDLEGAKDSAVLIRTFMEKNLSIVDLMIDVGSDRLKNKPLLF